jgi:TRAP transporter TAXI family solute receptor
MNKKASVIVALALAMMLVFAACSGGAATPAPNGGEGMSVEPTNLVFATGGVSGTYYPYGAAVATTLGEKIQGLSLSVQSTGASAANLRLIDSGEAQVAIVQNDVMSYAYNGTETFNGEVVDGFATMATVYAEVCQIVVDANSGIKSVADLKGKRVSVGDAGSGVEANAKQILAAYDITFDDIKKQNLGFGTSADAMKDKKIDAFFVTAGAPTTAVTELCTSKDIKILNIDEDKIASLIEAYPFYTSFTIPADTYDKVTEDVKTLAVKATLIVKSDLDEQLVYYMTKALFEGKDEIAVTHDKGKELNTEEAVKGVSVPLHPGAAKYFKEIGIEVE